MVKKISHKPKSSENFYEETEGRGTNQPSNLLILLLIVVSFFAGYLFFKVKSLEQGKNTNLVNTTPTQIPQQPSQRPTELKIKKPDVSEHWKGNKNVRFVWVEYSDLECPYCKRIHPDLTKLIQTYNDKLAWVFRHYPLPFHPKAQKSAEATECANELGGNDAFWKMNDLIYDKMPTMELTELPSFASQIGLNQSAFKQCLDSGKYEQSLKDNVKVYSNSGVQATPTGVLYDLKTGKTKLIEGALPYESLKQAVDDFMKG